MKTRSSGGLKVFIFACLWLAAGSSLFAGATVLRVESGVTGSSTNPNRDGKTWESAFYSIQDAIAASQPSAVQPVEIWADGSLLFALLNALMDWAL
ncbi:MAG: hypothetical protein EOP84_16385, partial [Verrucomicrobiaceae bacterium]